MSDFTINSLLTAPLIDSDNMIKSDENGALQKVSGSGIKNYVLGSESISPYTSISDGLVKTSMIKRNTTLGSSNINEVSALVRFGNDCRIEFSEKTVSERINGAISGGTLPDGYKGTSIQAKSVGVGVDASTGAIYPIIGIVQNSSIIISAGAAHPYFGQGDKIYLICRWKTDDNIS